MCHLLHGITKNCPHTHPEQETAAQQGGPWQPEWVQAGGAQTSQHEPRKAAHRKRGARRQLPLHAAGYGTCVALPSAKIAAKGLMSTSFRNRLGFF